MKSRRSYCVNYISEIHVGFRSCRYGELTALKKYFKENGMKITEIEYLENGHVVDRKKF